MEARREVREFLTSRRARLTPEQTGLVSFGARRVPGLRREEVAVLAGVSVPYYTRLERGDISGVSESVLHALSRALRLDDAERSHLFNLARAAQPPGVVQASRAPRQRVRPETQWTLDAMTGAAAIVANDRLDVLATNQLGRALFAALLDTAAPNYARFLFLDERARVFYPEWERYAIETTALLRAAAGRGPADRELAELITQLSAQSDVFRASWETHDVRFHRSTAKHLDHPAVGELVLAFSSFELAADPGLTLHTYTPEPRSCAEDTIRLLGSLVATAEIRDPRSAPA
jgi:transcriptional regulator with XRE-family HTH domain